MANPIDFILRNGLQVTNNVVVGSYTLTNAAPLNGMIVSGDVGIGTANPNQKLHVVGNIQITNSASAISGIYFPDGTFQSTSAESYSTPPGGPTNSVQYNNGSGFGGSGNFTFHSGNSHVGIGTSEAKYLLHVVGNDGPAVFSTRNGTNYEIQVGNNSPIGSNVIVGYNPVDGFGYFTAAQNNLLPSVIVTQTGQVGINSTAPTASLTVGGNAAIGWTTAVTVPDNSLSVAGNIGIGDSSPSAKLSIIPTAGQTAIKVTSDGEFLSFINTSLQSKFVISSAGTVTTGIWQGSSVELNYGGTGLNGTGWSTGQLLYKGTSGTTLSRLNIQPYGNVLITNNAGDAPEWGKLDLGTMVAGKVKIENGGTNASAFSGNAIVITAGNGLVMSSLTSNTNAAVVFDNNGGPQTISGGPYTYLTTDSGSGDLTFTKVNAQYGISGTLQIANGGTGTPSVPQYALLYGSGNTVSMSTLLTGVTSALVTGATGSPQWTSGSVANRVLRTDGTSITFSQVDLTTDVSGTLPLANGGTNASLTPSAGGMVYSTATALAISSPAALTWDNVNGRLGINTNSPTGYLDVNGNVVIRNGANIVAGGLYVQSGVSNFASSVIVSDLTSNTVVYTQYLNAGTAANVQSITSNTSVIVNGTEDAISTTTGALTVAGGVGIEKSLVVGNSATIGGNLYIAGNLVVNGNVSYINTNVAVIEDPSIAIGTGPNGEPLTSPDSYDRGLEYHYYDNGGDRYGFIGWQNSSGQFIYINNATAGSSSGIYSGPLGDAAFGNIFIGSALNTPAPSTSTSTGALVIDGEGGIGVGGNIYVGGTVFGTVDTAINASNVSVTETQTNSTFYPSFFESTSGNLTARVKNTFTFNPGTGLLSLIGSITAQNIGQFGSISVTNTTPSTSAATGALVVAGGVGITGNLYTLASAAHGNLSITNTTATTSSTTGALVVAGGIGAAGNIFTSGSLWAGNASITDTTPSTSSSTGSLVVAGGVGVSGNIVTDGGVQASNLLLNDTTDTTSSTTGTLVVAGGIGVGGNIFTSGSVWAGNLSINNDIPSTSTTTGSLVVKGGVGIQGNLFTSASAAHGNLSITNATPATSTTTGALTVAGGVGIVGNLYAGGWTWLNNATITSSNTTTSATTGALVVAGGVGISGNIYVAGSAWASNLSLSDTTETTSSTTGALVVAGGIGAEGNIFTAGGVFASNLSLFDTTETTSSTTGALIVAGGIGISGNIFTPSSIWAGNISVTDTTPSTNSTSGALVVAGGIGAEGNIITSGGVQASNLLLTDTTETTNSTTGALIVSGGIGAEGNIYTAGGVFASNLSLFDTTETTSSTTGALIVSGGIGAEGNIYTAGGVFASNLSLFDTTETTSSTTGALVVAGGIGAEGNIFTAGSLWAGNISITNSTSSSSTAEGALVVAGGVGIGENINAAGTITVNKVISNTTVSGNAFILNGNVTAFGTTGSKILDSWPIAVYRTAHYMVQITDNTNNQFHVVQITIMHDDTTVYKTEYNIMFSNNISDPNGLGTFDASISSGTLSLTFTPIDATNKIVKLIRTGIEI